MKTAEEWMQESVDSKYWITSNRFDKSFIQRIQLDAYRDAMSEAALMAFKRDGDAKGICDELANCIQIAGRILIQK